MGWLALVLTNSAAFVGQINFLSGLPILVLSVPAGVLLDRIDRRRALLVAQLLGTMVALGVAAVGSGNRLLPWHLLLAGVLNGTLLTLSMPTAQALVADTVERDDLTTAFGPNAAGTSATRILAASLGGVIIGVVGAIGSFVFQACRLLLAAGCTFGMQANQPRQRTAHRGRRRPTGAVLATLRHDPVLAGLLVQAMIPGLLAYPVTALLPVLARDHLGLGPSGLGVLMASSGVGAIAGSLIVTLLGAYPHKGRLLLALGVSYGFVLTSFAQSPWVVLSCALFACSSCVGMLHNALTTVLLQARTPEELRGQLTGALTLSFGLTPIGAFGLGLLAERIGASNAFTCGALATSLLIGLTMLAWRSLRHL